MQSWKSSKSANLLDKISWHLREEKVISWWTHQLHEVHQLERVLSRRQVHKVCRNTKLCHGVWLNSTLTLHTPKHQALHTVKQSNPQELQDIANTKPCTVKHQALYTVKHQALHPVKPSGMAGYSKHQALHTNTKPCTQSNTVKPSRMAGHSQTPSPAHSQTHRQTLREGRTQSNTKHTVKHIGKHFGMAVYNKLPLTAVLNIASLTW